MRVHSGAETTPSKVAIADNSAARAIPSCDMFFSLACPPLPGSQRSQACSSNDSSLFIWTRRDGRRSALVPPSTCTSRCPSFRKSRSSVCLSVRLPSFSSVRSSVCVESRQLECYYKAKYTRIFREFESSSARPLVSLFSCLVVFPSVRSSVSRRVRLFVRSSFCLSVLLSDCPHFLVSLLPFGCSCPSA